ncbi:hypothetical protein [Nitratireductor aestuarii]|uniref:hypothetical protein n=1 Tax=Nitratireductor aestuarii TaxID=1735103 RepID=UPI00166E04FB|nr:hypothetical protein [Nitratireductor aestuarii]
MSTNQQAGPRPASRSISSTGEWSSSQGQPMAEGGAASGFALREAASRFEQASSRISTDEALARLDAASAEAEEGGEASLWKLWPAITGGAIALALLGTWAGFAFLGEQPQLSSPAAEATASGVENMRPFVLVSFDDRATMAQITRSLQALGVEIESGPLPGGVYRVSIPAEDGTTYDAIAAKLDQDPLVGRLVIGRRPPN